MNKDWLALFMGLIMLCSINVHGDGCDGLPDISDCSEGADGDGCYVYQSGCEERDYYCSSGSCVYSFTNRGVDGVFGGLFCMNDDVYRRYRDYACVGVTCSYTLSNQLVEDCNDGIPYTVDTCEDSHCTSGVMPNPYIFVSSLSEVCSGASFPVNVEKNGYFVPDNTLFDFYLGNTKVRDDCTPAGDLLWNGACGIEDVYVPAGQYDLKARYRVWGHNYETVIVEDFRVTTGCSTNIQCVHGEALLTNTVGYNLVFDDEYVLDSEYDYVIGPGTGMDLRDISTYNSICSDGALADMLAPVVSWVYSDNGNKEAVSDNGLNPQYCHVPDLDRSDIIGPASKTEGTKFEGNQCSRPWGKVQHTYMDVHDFNNPGSYVTYVDLLHAWCDSPVLYICPWLNWSWRSTLCRMQQFDTPFESEGWVPLNQYSIFVPYMNLTIDNPEDVFDPPQRELFMSWTINNTGTGRADLRIERNCADWTCDFIGYAEGSMITLDSGESYILYMNMTVSPSSIYTKEVGITVTYDDSYGLGSMPERTVDSSIKVTIPHVF
ncbi:MAG: hypothetical protein JW724_06560 [Candidatus Altiarchaeota archaeon]|nr:hypothetical protein [Candidatus Altiarchaeota archaeon]